MRTNHFTNTMSKKSNAELDAIIHDKSKYTDEAIQAVIWELENRELLEKDEIIVEKTSLEEALENSVSENVDEKSESSFEEFEKPVLYSKMAILGFTFFFSPIFGAVLLMSNLKAVNKPVARLQVLFFAIGYTVLSVFVLNYFPRTYFTTFIFNIIGYAILTEFFWNKTLGKNLQFIKKPVSKPLLISLLIISFLVFLQFLPQVMTI